MFFSSNVTIQCPLSKMYKIPKHIQNKIYNIHNQTLNVQLYIDIHFYSQIKIGSHCFVRPLCFVTYLFYLKISSHLKYIIHPYSSGNCAPGDICQYLETILIVTRTGMQQREARDVAKHPTEQGSLSYNTKELPMQMSIVPKLRALPCSPRSPPLCRDRRLEEYFSYSGKQSGSL